jgi:CheY-like chemotaxis protein
LAFTCGDPAGVGPEVIAEWLRGATDAEAARVEIHGPLRWLEQLPRAGRFAARPVGSGDFVATAGRPDDAGARVAAEALRNAAAAARDGRVEAVVTGPVAKSAMARVGWDFPGQTEFFAAEWGGDPVMAFCGGRLRVVLATWHIPLAAVPAALDQPTLARAKVAATPPDACAQRAVAPRQERAAPVVDVQVLKGMKVLMAEDHPTNQKVVQIILDPFGIDLTIVGNGEEAVAAWSEHRFDAVLMDMQMPVMDGLTATRAIREREAADGRPRALIIMLTANAMPEHIEAGRKAGADGHLAKPVTMASLFAGITQVLASSEPESEVRAA